MSASISSRLYFCERAGDDERFAGERAAGGAGGGGFFDVELHAGVAQLVDHALAFAAVQECVERIGDFGADAGELRRPSLSVAI